MHTTTTNPRFITRACRRRAWLTAWLLLGACLWWTASASAAADRVITLVGDPWPPFVEGQMGGIAISGIGVVLAQRIFERIDGVDVVFPLIPWNRALREVASGASDGVGVLLKTPEREQYMVFTEPLFVSRSLVWYAAARHPDKFQWRTLADLTSGRLGTTRGYSYGAEVDEAIASGSLPVTEAPSVEHLFTMLAAGRIDFALANDAVGYALAREHAEARIVAAARPTGEEVFHMGLSRRSDVAALVPDINRVLAELRAEGVIDTLLGREPEPAAAPETNPQ